MWRLGGLLAAGCLIGWPPAAHAGTLESTGPTLAPTIPVIPAPQVVPHPEAQPAPAVQPPEAPRYTCPRSQYLDCMPPVQGAKKALCGEEYLKWATAHCAGLRVVY